MPASDIVGILQSPHILIGQCAFFELHSILSIILVQGSLGVNVGSVNQSLHGSERLGSLLILLHTLASNLDSLFQHLEVLLTFRILECKTECNLCIFRHGLANQFVEIGLQFSVCLAQRTDNNILV